MSRSRSDRLVAPALGLLTFAVAAYCAPRGFHFGFTDMGHDGYQLRQVLDISRGGVIFRDTFDQYGALNGYLNALAFVALGHRLLSIKWLLCGWYGASAALLYFLGRRWLGPVGAAFGVTIWLGLAPFYQHGVMISPHASILMLQLVAVLLLTRVDFGWHSGRRLLLVGVLSGIMWAMKQSYGVLFLVALVAFVGLLVSCGRVAWRVAGRGMALIVCGFSAVVTATLAALWWAGALHDWYLQTISFPQGMYLAGGSAGGILATLSTFVTLQRSAATYWFVIRGVVIGAGIVALFRRAIPEAALLFATLTLMLWLGAYPSANFMHQWWTTSLSIVPFVVILWSGTQPLRLRAARAAAVVAVVLAVVGFGVTERLFALREQSKRLDAVIEAPPVVRGVRTPAATKRIFAAVYAEMRAYRTKHPGAGVVSIEAASEPASLPFVSFFPDSPHIGPVYWNEPVLATSTYPHHVEQVNAQIAASQPLLVDHTLMEFAPKKIDGYMLRLAAPSDYGYWYVYEPIEVGLETVFLNSSGSPTVLPASPAARQATIEQPNDWNVYGGRTGQSLGGATLYTFPGTLAERAIPDLDRVVPIADAPTMRIGAVTELAPGAWTIDGHISDRYAYALKFPVVRREKGALFVARGEVQDGGITIGVTQHDQWYAVINISRQGPFLVVLQMPDAGAYELTVANCVESRLQNALGLLTKRFLQNHVRVLHAGWIPAQP